MLNWLVRLRKNRHQTVNSALLHNHKHICILVWHHRIDRCRTVLKEHLHDFAQTIVLKQHPKYNKHQAAYNASIEYTLLLFHSSWSFEKLSYHTKATLHRRLSCIFHYFRWQLNAIWLAWQLDCHGLFFCCWLSQSMLAERDIGKNHQPWMQLQDKTERLLYQYVPPFLYFKLNNSSSNSKRRCTISFVTKTVPLFWNCMECHQKHKLTKLWQ